MPTVKEVVKEYREASSGSWEIRLESPYNEGTILKDGNR